MRRLRTSLTHGTRSRTVATKVYQGPLTMRGDAPTTPCYQCMHALLYQLLSCVCSVLTNQTSGVHLHDTDYCCTFVKLVTDKHI